MKQETSKLDKECQNSGFMYYKSYHITQSSSKFGRLDSLARLGGWDSGREARGQADLGQKAEASAAKSGKVAVWDFCVRRSRDILVRRENFGGFLVKFLGEFWLLKHTGPER